MIVRAGNAALRPRPLRIVTPACIASAAVALGATVSSDCLLQPFFDKSLVQRIVGASMAALFGVAGTHWALARAPSEWNALRGSALTGAVVLSWFMLCDRLASLQVGGSADTLATLLLPLLLVVVGAIGAMVGTLFGLTAVAVVRPVESARVRRSLDAPERVLLPASVWLCAWGLAFIAMRHPRSLPPFGLVVLGLAGLCYVFVRDASRLRFLSAVFGGVEPRFRVCRAPAPVGAALPAYGPYPDSVLDGQLVPGKPAGGPYRSCPPEPPVARIPLALSAATRPLRRRMAVTAALVTLVLTITATRLEVSCLTW